MGKNDTNNPILTKEKSEIFSVDKCREDILDVEKEVQSIIKNSTQMKKNWDIKFEKKSPPLYGSKIVSPRFCPRLMNNLNLNFDTSSDICEDRNLRSSSSNLFRAFSHSPSPKDVDTKSINQVRMLEESFESEDERSITPPLRTSNPIIYNSTFGKFEKKSRFNQVDIGLLSISPPLVPNNRIEEIRKLTVDVKFDSQVSADPLVVNNSRRGLNSVEEIDELLFRFDSI